MKPLVKVDQAWINFGKLFNNTFLTERNIKNKIKTLKKLQAQTLLPKLDTESSNWIDKKSK